MKKKKRNLLCVLLSAAMCLSMIPSSTAEAITVTTSSGQTIVKNQDQIKGTEDGYSYELWNQNDAGTAVMTLGQGGAYSCEWNGIENVLFRRGVDFDCTKTYKELGNISIEYEADYNNPSQNTYLCVYGWTRNPLIEYYIVDSWGSWRPPGADSTMGTITVDGGTYDVYVTDRINQPSIDGNTTFKQYWSVRQSKRTSGTISVSQHFAEWEKLGMETGKLYEAALNVEGYMSSGSANVKKNIVTVGGEITPIEPVKPIEPDDNGYYFHDTFESGTGNWSSRGDTSVAVSSSAAAAGSKSLSVTGRTDAWNGAAITLDTAAFVPGNSYSFSVLAMQNTAQSDNFKLSLQYDKDGETNYATVAEGTGSKGKWVQLANTSYTIPSGASNLLLYVETEDSTNSFFMDEAIGAVNGTKINVSLPGSDDAVAGDADGNGVFELKDLVVLQKYLGGLSVSIDLNASDADGNGRVNIFDLAVLKNKICGNSGGSGNNPADDPIADGYFKSTFESGNDGWTSRGGTTLTSDTANYYSGSKSVKVSGRTSAWQGIAYELDSKTFVPGNSYSFSTAAMHAGSAAEEMHLTLQYTDQAGETAYSMIASETVESCKWTKLENTSYTIPAGASDLLLYVETVDTTTDFYIDEAVVAAAGTKSSVVTGSGKVTATPAAAGGVDIS